MSPVNQQKIRERINVAAQRLKGKLPDVAHHPKGRNPHAHIPAVIKSLFGCSYKDLPDEAFDFVVEVIGHCEKNPF